MEKFVLHEGLEHIKAGIKMGIYVFIMSMMTMVINMEMYGNGQKMEKCICIRR